MDTQLRATRAIDARVEGDKIRLQIKEGNCLWSTTTYLDNDIGKAIDRLLTDYTDNARHKLLMAAAAAMDE